MYFISNNVINILHQPVSIIYTSTVVGVSSSTTCSVAKVMFHFSVLGTSSPVCTTLAGFLSSMALWMIAIPLWRDLKSFVDTGGSSLRQHGRLRTVNVVLLATAGGTGVVMVRSAMLNQGHWSSFQSC